MICRKFLQCQEHIVNKNHSAVIGIIKGCIIHNGILTTLLQSTPNKLVSVKTIPPETEKHQSGSALAAVRSHARTLKKPAVNLLRSHSTAKIKK